MTQRDIMIRLLTTTPGVVSDDLMRLNGVNSAIYTAKANKLPVDRVRGLGYRWRG